MNNGITKEFLDWGVKDGLIYAKDAVVGNSSDLDPETLRNAELTRRKRTTADQRNLADDDGSPVVGSKMNN